MKNTKKLLLLVTLTIVLTSCSTPMSNNPANPGSVTSTESSVVLSPFTQFENLKRDATGINSEQMDEILWSYGIYDILLSNIPTEVYKDSVYLDVRISGFNVGNKKGAVLLIDKGHLFIFIMFSNTNGKWIANGFTYQTERDKPEYRVEQSSDQMRYWLVVKHEANHGTGLYIYDEVWYNPDGSVAAEYPIEGSNLFFPEDIEPGANTHFSTSASFDGDSKVSLAYSINFEYGYKDSIQDNAFYRFESVYHPVIREYWDYDLKTQQFKFISCQPTLPESLSKITHTVSAEYGILQGYIDFYKSRLGNKKITTLEEWEEFMGLK